MKKKFLFLLTIVFAFLSQSLLSQVEDPLIYRYRRIAVDYQQQVKMAQRSLEGAQSQLKAAKSGYGPQLDFYGDYGFYGVPLKLAPAVDAPAGTPGEELHNLYSLDLTLYQPLVTGGRLKNTKLAAESEVESMQSYVRISEQEIMLNSDKIYLNTVAKKEIHKLAVAYKDIVGKFVDIIKSRVEEEIVGKNELYQSMVTFNDAQYQVLSTETDYEMSIMNLNKLLGFPMDSIPLISDSLSALKTSLSSNDINNTALANRPELDYLKGKAMASQYREKIITSKYKPQLGALFGGKWGAPSPGLNIDPDFNYYLKAQLKIPIFYWGEKKNIANSAKQATEIAKLKIDQTEDSVILEVQKSYLKLEKSQEQMIFAKGALNNSQNNVNVMLNRYNESLSSVLEVLDAQTYWQKSYFNYIQSKYNVNLAYSEYLRALGEIQKENQ